MTAVAPSPEATERLRMAEQALAKARLAAAGSAAVVIELQNQFQTTHAPLIEAAKRDALAMQAADAQVRELATALYRDCGEKNPTPYVSITESIRLEYDEAEAFAWAKAKGLAIQPEQLNRKEFEKLAKTTAPEFVTIAREPSVRIASDLTPVLAVQHG